MAGFAAVFEILLGFLACAVTSLAVGVTLLRILRIDLNRAEAVCLGYIVGSALASTLTLVIALLWIAWKGVFLALAAGSLILLCRQWRWWIALKPAPLLTIPRALRLLFYVAWLAYGVLYFRQSLSPEMSPDGMTYHLGLVNLWNHAHGLARNSEVFAALPHGMEMLFLFAFSIGRHSAAALVHFSFLMVLPWLMVLFGCRFGWPRGAAVLAAILTFASPLVGMDGTVAYVDVALATVVFAIVFLFEIWRQERASGPLLAASLLTGFALAVKPTSVYLVVFVVATFLWELRRSPRRLAPRVLLIAVAAAVAVPAPYFIRNVIWFQNPIAFFGNRIFPNRWFHVSFEQSFTQNNAHLFGVTWRELPRELTIGGPKMQESFGPAFVLLPLALVGLIWPRTRFLLLAALLAAYPFAANKTARFLIPGVPLAAMAAAFVVCRLPRSSLLAGGIAVVHLVVSWPSLNNSLHISSGWRIVNHIPWKVALRQEPEEDFLAQSDAYLMARLAETHVPEGEPALTLLDSSAAQSYTLRPILVDWESAFAERMSDLLLAAADSPRQGSRTWTGIFPQSRVTELRISQTGKAGTLESMWSINEIRLWAAGAPLPYSPLWRLRSRPNPWDIGLAFDGSEATRWRSWDTLRPGMWIDVQFDKALAIDRVEVLSHDGQWDSNMAVSVLTESGEWMPTVQSSWRMDPPLDLRREASIQMKNSGVRFIGVSREKWNGWPFHGDFAGWGMHEVASTRKSVLLRVD